MTGGLLDHAGEGKPQADHHDLDEQARVAFRPGWPESIFYDPISSEYIGRAETNLWMRHL